ncbi:MAG: amino acid ABC transporter permease [Christensenellales bacterium]|jgi:His/Glu/Gln/Arg/opine family amino acid ABC transporter permease subunit
MADWWQTFVDKFTIAFVDHNRWKFITQGLTNTLVITFFAVVIGIVIGFIVSVIRVTHDKTGKLKIGNAICQVYLAVIRGTPVMVQIMIIYFVIFAAASTTYKIPLAILAFGINSGAYVAEIFRGGINAIDAGQFEAGRSLGFNYVQTMWYIIAPQAFKNAIPPLANEFIVLLKETSVAGYIGVEELTRGAFSIGGSTYDYTLPLLAVALIYLALVVGLSRLVALLERRLRRSER